MYIIFTNVKIHFYCCWDAEKYKKSMDVYSTLLFIFYLLADKLQVPYCHLQDWSESIIVRESVGNGERWLSALSLSVINFSKWIPWRPRSDIYIKTVPRFGDDCICFHDYTFLLMKSWSLRFTRWSPRFHDSSDSNWFVESLSVTADVSNFKSPW